jgi:hypothetical protein
MSYYENASAFDIPGYEIFFTRFADSIIKDHFQDARNELSHILEKFYVPEDDIIKGGGGLSSITQSLAKLLNQEGWTKKIIESSLHVGSKILPSKSHEVDHYKSFKQGNIGLEIEWNNKDPFYDRDLENFRKVHQMGELSFGIIVTRGVSLQTELQYVYERFLSSLEQLDMPTLLSKISMSDIAKDKIEKALTLERRSAIKLIAAYIYGSKFGAATTHMSKLLLRLKRGVGDPCPFILIGIGRDRLTKS